MSNYDKNIALLLDIEAKWFEKPTGLVWGNYLELRKSVLDQCWSRDYARDYLKNKCVKCYPDFGYPENLVKLQALVKYYLNFDSKINNFDQFTIDFNMETYYELVLGKIVEHIKWGKKNVPSLYEKLKTQASFIYWERNLNRI